MQTVTYGTALFAFVNTFFSAIMCMYLAAKISMFVARRSQRWRNREDLYFVFLTAFILASFHGLSIIFVMWILI